MFFPFTGVEINLFYLILLGFFVGFLGGFFGIGGGSIYVPLLFLMGIPMPIAVGTSLAFIGGKSVVGMFTHFKLDNVDIQLGVIMVIGVIPGTEVGALIIEYLENQLSPESVNHIIIICYILILSIIAVVMLLESVIAIKSEQLNKGKDIIFFRWIIDRVSLFPFGPRIKLKNQETEVSIWIIGFLGFFTGLLSGFLGVGGGFVRVPLLIYVLGVPTTIAIGTDLLEVMVSSAFGTLSHSLKGNVDLLIAIITSLWGCIGAYFGAILTQYVSGQKIRLLFVSIPIISIIILLFQII
ncbi:MAG: sulfite exporter TauE/SafE family protein [Candidatus Hodarchaeota archaeon]